jgi:hypothetical protein
MCQTNTGEPIALRKRGMSVDGLSKLDTTNLAAPDHWHREACFQPSALRGTYGLRGPRPFARERPFSGVELCDLNFHCGSGTVRHLTANTGGSTRHNGRSCFDGLCTLCSGRSGQRSGWL